MPLEKVSKKFRVTKFVGFVKQTWWVVRNIFNEFKHLLKSIISVTSLKLQFIEDKPLETIKLILYSTGIRANSFSVTKQPSSKFIIVAIKLWYFDSSVFKSVILVVVVSK